LYLLGQPNTFLAAAPGLHADRRGRLLGEAAWRQARLGINPIVALEKQPLNMIGNLV
jgi:hypothetical protein